MSVRRSHDVAAPDSAEHTHTYEEEINGVRCSYESPYDGFRCPMSAIPGGERPLCIFHSQDPNKNPRLVLQALQKKFQEGDFFFDGYVFSSPIDFREIDFRGSVSFHETVFQQGATFAGCRFRGRRVIFSQCTFGGLGADFSDAVFQTEDLRFDSATFGGEKTSFNRCRFNTEQATFENACFHAGETNFSEAVFSGERISFNQADMSSPWILFEGASQHSGILLFLRASLQAKMVSFEEFDQSGGVLNLQGLRARGGTISFAGAVFEGQGIRSERAQLEAERVSWERVSWNCSENANYRKIIIKAKEITFANSQASVPHMDFRQGEFDAQRILFTNVSWGENVSFMESRWKAHEISFDNAHFMGDELRLDGIQIDSRFLHQFGAKLLCGRTCLSGSHLRIEVCDWSRSNIEGDHFSAQGLDWKGKEFRLDGMNYRSKRVGFNRSKFSGDVFSLKGVHFFANDVSFAGVLFHTGEILTEGLSLSGSKLRLSGNLESFRLGDLDLSAVDFSGSTWPLTSRFGRPICRDEIEASSLEELEAVAKIYEHIAEHYRSDDGYHLPEDFLYAALDCGRLHAQWTREPWERLRLEWRRWATGYGTSPWRSIIPWIGLSFLSLMLATISGQNYLTFLWPLSLSKVQPLVEYLTSFDTSGFPQFGITLHPLAILRDNFIASFMGLLTSISGYATFATIVQDWRQRKTPVTAAPTEETDENLVEEFNDELEEEFEEEFEEDFLDFEDESDRLPTG